MRTTDTPSCTRTRTRTRTRARLPLSVPSWSCSTASLSYERQPPVPLLNEACLFSSPVSPQLELLDRIGGTAPLAQAYVATLAALRRLEARLDELDELTDEKVSGCFELV
jgi:hypothetical protein